ncbi:MAG: type II secretion system F family protein [Dehalococcoidia bacterium]
MIILLAALAGGAAIFVGVYTLVTPERRSVPDRLNRYDRGAQPGREELLAEPFSARVGLPVLAQIRSIFGRALPSSMVRSIEQRLILAGEPTSLHAFIAIQLSAIAAGVFVVVAGLASANTPVQALAALVAGLFLAVIPLYWLRLRVAARKKAILKALPDAVDLVVTTVEAGLALDAALAEVGHETEGPLGEELRLTVRETTLGRSRRDALARLIDRTQVPELKTFVQAIIQAEQTGIPIGQVLRTQAAQIRLKKRQRAEAEAQRAPVKMVIVLALLVLPAMLLLVIGPAIIRMSEQI